MIKNCPKCGNEFESTPLTYKRERKFCSRKCANSREFTEESNRKRADSLRGRRGHTKNKGKPSPTKIPRIIKICLECSKEFEDRIDSTKKYCSFKCSYKNAGGYREGSGRSRHGYYKGIYSGSTYELVWIIYRLDHNLPVTRFEGFLKEGRLKYFPDFIIDNTIIEIKGYHRDTVDIKKELAESKGYKVCILYKDDLAKEFEWVQSNYSYKHVHELYDDFKPAYVYNCSYCNIEFTREKKLKTDDVFCSRQCCGKGHKRRVK